MIDYNVAILGSDSVIDGRLTLARHATKTWRRRDPAKIVGVVYHQSLAHNGSAEATARYHVGPNHISDTGLPGLSYTMFVNRVSGVYLANDVEAVTYSQGDASKPGDENELYLAVCFGGNFSGPDYIGTQEPSMFQKSVALSLWLKLKGLFKLTNRQLYGHYQFGKPCCPGNALRQIIENVNSTPEQDLIKKRHEALIRLGFYKGLETSEWSLESRYALSQFQKSVGIKVDGVWGPITEAAVQAALAKSQP